MWHVQEITKAYTSRYLVSSVMNYHAVRYVRYLVLRDHELQSCSIFRSAGFWHVYSCPLQFVTALSQVIAITGAVVRSSGSISSVDVVWTYSKKSSRVSCGNAGVTSIRQDSVCFSRFRKSRPCRNSQHVKRNWTLAPYVGMRTDRVQHTLWLH